MRDLSLECAVVEWLRYERRCMVVCLERGLRHDYRPDVFAVTRSRHAIEVECKRTVADFRADAAKRIACHRERGLLNVQQFYYVVPPTIVDAVRPLLPAYAGLLTLGTPDSSYTKLPRVEVEHGSPVNRMATRLSKYEMGRMVMHQTATLHRLLAYLVKHDPRRP